jgi:hypothetical protein
VALRVAGGRTVSVQWVRKRREAEAAVIVDGRTVLHKSDRAIGRAVRSFSGVVYAGNDPAGKRPFLGRVDEVRISKRLRRFYALAVGWTDPEAKRPIPAGRPYLREEADLLFYAPFDGSLDAKRAAGQPHAEPRPAGELKEGDPVPEPTFKPGVRGRAVLLGAGRAMPAFSAPENLRLEEGSFELWFSPYDWDNRRAQELRKPMWFVPILRARNEEQKLHGGVFQVGILRLKVHNKPAAPLLRPGEWYHVVGTWDGGRKVLYLNGERMPPNMVYFHKAKAGGEVKPEEVFLEPVHNRRLYHGEQTLVDELRFYSRPLTPEEVRNAYARYRPDRELKPLPFAHADLTMNHPLERVSLLLELLSPKRGDVTNARVRVFGPGGADPIGEALTPAFEDGRAKLTMQEVPVRYGKHRVELSFLSDDGGEVGTMSIERDRQAPPWLGSTVGRHPDEVLPGWEPMEADDGVVTLWGRRIEFGPNGWPRAIISQNEDMLAGPVAVRVVAGGQEVGLQPGADEVRIEHESRTGVVTAGAASGGRWQLRTRTDIDYDGMMRVEMMLSGEEPGEIEGLTVEIPLKERDARYYGYWTGARNFRAAAWYGSRPDKEGVFFRSDRPRRRKNGRLRGSFLPYVTLAGDHRGLAWFAESDRGWTKHEDRPSIELERREARVILRLNVVQETTRIEDALRIVFGLQPAPVRPLAEDRRSEASLLHFGWVDGFSKQDLKTPGNWGSFNIYPYEYDWEAAKRRAELHQFHYGHGEGYEGPYLYVDRNWVGLPPDTWEYRGIWYRSGFFRYYKEAANCYLWNMDQWMKHGLIHGIYIDDAWIGTFKDPERGPAYRLPDGTVQPGFEFFDYHEFMRRLRWIFIDNGLRPRIWVHMTNTHYLPILSFADFILDGEWKFLGWGDKRDFMDMWRMGRFRFSNPQSWGLTQVWMNKIGADEDKPVEMPHWEYHQRRSYHAMLMAHDITAIGDRLKDAARAGLYSDEADFIGYWESSSPVELEQDRYVASVYRFTDHAILVVVNTSGKTDIAELQLDAKGLLGAQGTGGLMIEDIDTYRAPRGEDITKVAKPETPVMPGEEEEDVIDDFENMIEEDRRREQERQKRGFLFRDHNFQWKDGTLKLRVREHDYRLLEVRPGTGDEAESGLLIP